MAGLQGRTFKSQKKSYQESSGLGDQQLNEAYFGSYGPSKDAHRINLQNQQSNHQLAFVADKMPFAQAVERQYLDSFIATSPTGGAAKL